MDKIAPYAKAIIGFLLPGLVAIGYALTAWSDSGSHITASEWITALVAMFTTGAAVFAVPNKPKVDTPRERAGGPVV